MLLISYMGRLIRIGILGACLVLWMHTSVCAVTLTDSFTKDSSTNKQSMKKAVLKALRDHRKHIRVTYKGIEKDMKRLKNDNYMKLWESLQLEDGYHTGIVSGYCISNVEEEGIEYIDFQFNYLTTKKQEQYIDLKTRKIVKNIIKSNGKTRYAKVKGTHDYLIRHMRYDSKYYNPYYAFKKGKGLCMSYSLAFQRILQEMNIPCVYVKGKEHAWNMVKLGKYWYNVDVTWDDSIKNNSIKSNLVKNNPVISYRYFLRGDHNFPGHDLPKSSYIRKLKKSKYDYIHRE